MASFLESYPAASPASVLMDLERTLTQHDVAAINQGVEALPVGWWSAQYEMVDEGTEPQSPFAFLRHVKGPECLPDFIVERRPEGYLAQVWYDEEDAQVLDPRATIAEAVQDVRSFVLELLTEWGVRPI